MRILVIANVVPYPPHGGSQLRILRILERVAAFHQVALCCHAWSTADEVSARTLTTLGIRTFTGRLRPQIDLSKIAAAARFGVAGRPLELALYRSSALTKVVRGLLRAEAFDIFQVEETVMAHYADLLLPDTRATPL